jgi:hypothetical protein
MTNTEFAELIGYISAGCGKSLSRESQVVYFDLLGDLPFNIGQLAAKRVLAEHKWSTFPSIAELRQAAVESLRGEVKELSGAKAWELAWRAVGRIDPEIDGSRERAFNGLPSIVVEAINAFGLLDLCYGKEPVGVLRGQFLRIFDQLAERERRAALLPPKVHQALDDVRGRNVLPHPAARLALEGIGKDAV